MCVDRKSVGSANSAFEAVDEGEALRSALLCSRREVEISWMRLSWRLTTQGKLDLLVAITERRFDRHGGNGEAWSTGQGKTAGIREEIDLGSPRRGCSTRVGP